MNIGYIYKFTLLPTNKIYVGKRHKSSFDTRYWGSGTHWKKDLKKYGRNNVLREVLEWCDTEELLDIREQYWIDKLDACNPNVGYNIAVGGSGGCTTVHMRWYNNGIEDVYIPYYEEVPNGYEPGRIKTDSFKSTKDKIWINNGAIEFTIYEEEIDNYPGFTRGMLYRGDDWKNHLSKPKSEETKNILSEAKKKFHRENPDFRNSGNWVKGQTAHNKSTISITNGIKNHYINPEELSEWEKEGWWRGNTQHHKPKEKK